MKLSLCILTSNSEKHLRKYIESLRLQRTYPDEVIVIDSSSTDNTTRMCVAQKFSVSIIEKKNFDHGLTRTIAAKKAEGDIVIFTTHDVIFADEYSIKNIVFCFENPNIGAAYGRQLPNKNADFFSTRLRKYNYPETSYVRYYEDKNEIGFKTAFLSDSFSAYRRSVLEEVGFFGGPIIFGEDAEIAARILRRGYGIGYCADACVYHSHNYSISQGLKRHFDVGVFHEQYKNLIREFGKPEGEGVKYVLQEICELLRIGKWYIIPLSFLKNGAKFFGYRLGRIHKIFPRRLKKLVSMNKGYWD